MREDAGRKPTSQSVARSKVSGLPASNSARSELLGSKERVHPARRGIRTADEIKEAYGRPTSGKYDLIIPA